MFKGPEVGYLRDQKEQVQLEHCENGSLQRYAWDRS